MADNKEWIMVEGMNFSLFEKLNDYRFSLFLGRPNTTSNKMETINISHGFPINVLWNELL